MSFTFRINKTDNALAKNLMDYIRSLAANQEYDFLQIIEDVDLTASQKKELDKRYAHFSEHKQEFEDWQEVYKRIKKK